MEVLIKLFQDGELPVLAQWLLLLNIIDVVTGFIKAIDTKTVSSKVMKHGALTKLIIWVVVFVSGIVSSYFKTDLTTYVIGYYLVMEVVSIFENATLFIPVPEKLKDILNTGNAKTTKREVSNTTTNEISNITIDNAILQRIKEKEEK